MSFHKTNVATAHAVTAEGNPVEDTDDAVVEILVHGLVIAKSNDAPIEHLELPDKTFADLPTAKEGSTVTFTLHYTFSGAPVTHGEITDVLPVGLTYVAGFATNTASSSSRPTTPTTRTLTWNAATVSTSGTVTYKAKVDKGAAALDQPLTNVATIDSDQTGPIRHIRCLRPGPAAGGDHVPTAPPTDTVDPTERASRAPASRSSWRSSGHPPCRPCSLSHRSPPPSSPEPPLGPSPAALIPPGGRGRPASPFPDLCVATPSDVRPGRSTNLGGVPRSLLCRVERRRPAALRRRSTVSKPGSTSSTGPSKRAARSRRSRRGRSPSAGG